MRGPPLDQLPEGHLFAGRYRIVRPLGEGWPGMVYLAVQEGLDREVSLKVLAREADDPQAESRFEREAAALARLNHPACAEVIDYGIHEDALFLAVHFVHGPSLADATDGPWAPLEALTLAIDLAEGLAHAHERGVVHRNLDPRRIVLVEAGRRRRRACMVDFGLARLQQADLDTTAGRAPVGTPAYMAPERVRGEAGDARTDVYGLGLILFELLTGEHPFRKDTSQATLHAQLTEKVPPLGSRDRDFFITAALERVVERACAPRPEARFEDGEALARALRAARLTLVHPELHEVDVDVREGRPVLAPVLAARLDEPTPTGAIARDHLADPHPAPTPARGRTGLVLLVGAVLVAFGVLGAVAVVLGLWAGGLLTAG
jgi:eukaryotic-like serine/threonine-protein kinase